MCTALISHIHKVLNPPPVKKTKKGKLTQVTTRLKHAQKKLTLSFQQFCIRRHTQVGD